MKAEKLENILQAAPTKVCPLLEHYFRENEDISEKEATAFNSTSSNKIHDLLSDVKSNTTHSVSTNNMKEVNKDQETIDHDNAVIILKFLDCICQYDDACKLLITSNILNPMCQLMIKCKKFLASSWTIEDSSTLIKKKIVWNKTLSTLLIAMNTIILGDEEDIKQECGDAFILHLANIVSEKRYNVELRRFAGENINGLLKKCKHNKDLLLPENHDIQHMKELATGIIAAGDYAIQANITETLYRISANGVLNDKQLNAIFSSFDKKDKIIVSFQAIRGDPYFLKDIRAFLMTVNETLTITKRCSVRSFQCTKLHLGSYESCDAKYVDFGDERLSFYSRIPNQDKALVDIEYRHLRTFRLNYKQGAIMVQLSKALQDFHQVYNQDNEQDYIKIHLNNNDLLIVKHEIAPIISECRHKDKDKEELMERISSGPRMSTTLAIHTVNQTLSQQQSVTMDDQITTQLTNVSRENKLSVMDEPIVEQVVEITKQVEKTPDAVQQVTTIEKKKKKKKLINKNTPTKKTQPTTQNSATKSQQKSSPPQSSNNNLTITNIQSDDDDEHKLKNWNELIQTKTTQVKAITMPSKSDYESLEEQEPAVAIKTLKRKRIVSDHDSQDTEDESNLIQGIVGLVQTSYKTNLDKKKRKASHVRDHIHQLLNQQRDGHVEWYNKEKEQIVSQFKDQIEETQKTIVGLSKKMKSTYTKFQNEISSHAQNHAILSENLDKLKEATKNAVAVLDKKYKQRIESDESEIKKELVVLDQIIKDMDKKGNHSNLADKIKRAFDLLQ
ncbi:hypothetical protein AKO1_011269 [Acrasis kona]|uniref:Uncharacterized protein n=1 Tax=Acrasis kona TaxID=1008807 RepID=A0AAW2YWL2_9EUKA